MKISLPVTIAVWLFAAIGVAFSFGFLGFSIRNRQTRIIKMSSPNLNNIMVMGSILCYISVILFGIDGRFLTLEEYTRICNVRLKYYFVWSQVRSAVLCIGYSLSFGAMFSKTWRVHKIFAAGASLKKMAIKDHHLLVTVAALLMTDVVFLSCWIATDPFQSEMRKFEETLGEVHREYQVVIIPALYQCTCKYKMYFFAVVFTYKGLLLLFGIFLAWETRNVTIPALNDSKYIGMSVYNVFVLSVIGAVVSLALEGSEHYNASYALLSMCLIMGTSLTMLLVFVPKIYHFYSKDEVTAQGIRAVHLMEGQNSQFSCKATQTTFNSSGCAGRKKK
ncbi:gamma-aminobutyric acid type B receptor subunit 2-like [Stylophora pistillata]|uniref:gamma-aminobutyric acid type B receptor subunit 2-like n=1 Tax=Stylophora pistillata TaxID=50429 RepID=UPI000C050394|nr:gamma-aminobutyric acid type B receptor subunit 2-like [Stylophora pistillata]